MSEVSAYNVVMDLSGNWRSRHLLRRTKDHMGMANPMRQ
jgi:hypothetical protein